MGTRPEAIKMAPVVRELQRRDAYEPLIVTTGQHREMLDQTLGAFGISPHVDLALMEHDQRPGDLAARAIAALTSLFAELEPDVVLVQGDTTTVAAAALAAFYLDLDVGHVEAGLRSHDPRSPFPEELNRRIVGIAAALHFAPTEGARDNLVREGAPPASVHVTGNTIVDAVQMIALDGPFDDPRLEAVDFDGRRIVFATAHRRESHGPALRSICGGLRSLVERYDDVEIVLPLHLNPRVRSVLTEELEATPRVHLVEPLTHRDAVKAMARSYLIMTDSGGIQEEAPSLRKPVLVLRSVTERPEVLEAGLARLVGTTAERIAEEAGRLLEDSEAYALMTNGRNPFGDGRAAQRIASILEDRLA